MREEQITKVETVYISDDGKVKDTDKGTVEKYEAKQKAEVEPEKYVIAEIDQKTVKALEDVMKSDKPEKVIVPLPKVYLAKTVDDMKTIIKCLEIQLNSELFLRSIPDIAEQLFKRQENKGFIAVKYYSVFGYNYFTLKSSKDLTEIFTEKQDELMQAMLVFEHFRNKEQVEFCQQKKNCKGCP